ncbi:MAG: DUF3800 domain-containing protein [Dehalococcoidia bacterium]
MYAFVDASGDEGFKFRRGSSLFYVVCVLLIEDPKSLDRRIDVLRAELRMAPHREFHFSDLSYKRRMAFFEAVASYPFSVSSIIVDKRVIWSPTLRSNAKYFRNYFTKMLLRYDWGSIHNARVIIDGAKLSEPGVRLDQQYLLGELKMPPREDKIKDIRFDYSHENNILQAMDMFAGATWLKYERGNSAYWHVARQKIEDEWTFR